MKYGFFDDGAREYVIENPKTPVKWINYLGSLRFGGFVDHTGGLLLCKGDPALNRITKYLPQLPSSQLKGHTLYLRVHTPDGPRTLSPLFVPGLERLDRFECRVGLGYTRFVSQLAGLRTELTLFVPSQSDLLVEDVVVTNVSNADVTLDAVPLIEYSHFDALKQLTNADWVPQTMQSVAHDVAGRTVLAQFAFMNRDVRQTFLSATVAASSYESCRARFLGDNEYGTYADPLSLKQPQLGCYQAQRGDNVGALLLPLGTLAPGASKRFRVLLTQQEGTRQQALESALSAFAQLETDAQADAALADIARYWDDYLGKLQVKTPSAALDSMLNVHNPRQCFMTKNWSRDLSLYQLGYGGRGIGFRDSSQDVMGVLASLPEEARELLEKLLSVQKPDGSAMHQFYASTLVANEGDAREQPDRPSYYADDQLWSVLAVCAYLKETGDLGFLQRELPFYDARVAAPERQRGSVRQHLERALAFTRQNVGRHGLPLLGFADWNDTVNLRAGAESLMVANLYGKALLEVIELCRELGDEPSAQRYQRDYEQMRERVNEHAWDGEWYLRYFDHDGSPIGARHNPHGRIWTNAQSWPVISGFASPERARSALDAVQRHLNTAHGIKLSAPGFDHYDPNKGGVTTYPPGAKENGGIFLHANPWVMIAETLLGNGDQAFQYYMQINPAARNDRIEEYELEPYVYAQNILGDEHPQFGLGRNSWLSGTASWCYQAATQHILGIRPSYRGLELDPCIPKAWDGFEVTRVFRGATYRIQVKNPQHVCRGQRSLLLDGKPLTGRVLPLLPPGEVHRVELTLGPPDAATHAQPSSHQPLHAGSSLASPAVPAE
jgi:cellobiose phosphorylase